MFTKFHVTFLAIMAMSDSQCSILSRFVWSSVKYRYQCLQLCKLIQFNCEFSAKVNCAFLWQEKKKELSELYTLKSRKTSSTLLIIDKVFKGSIGNQASVSFIELESLDIITLTRVYSARLDLFWLRI